MIAEKENTRREMTDEGFVFEPGYAGYLRSMGYNVEDIADIDTIQSEDPEKPDTKYLVARIKTYDKPMDHPDMDLVADQIFLPVCTCWGWRKHESADLDEQAPSESGVCKHLKKAYREVRAENDDAQHTL